MKAIVSVILLFIVLVNGQATPQIIGNDCSTSVVYVSFTGATGNYIQLSNLVGSTLYTQLNMSIAAVGNSPTLYFSVYTGETYYLNNGGTVYGSSFSTSTCSNATLIYDTEAVRVYNLARAANNTAQITRQSSLDNVARLYYFTGNLTEAAALGNYQTTGSLNVYEATFPLGTPINPGAAIQNLIFTNRALLGPSYTQIGAFVNQTNYGITGVTSSIVLVFSTGGTTGSTSTFPTSGSTTTTTTSGSATTTGSSTATTTGSSTATTTQGTTTSKATTTGSSTATTTGSSTATTTGSSTATTTGSSTATTTGSSTATTTGSSTATTTGSSTATTTGSSTATTTGSSTATTTGSSTATTTGSSTATTTGSSTATTTGSSTATTTGGSTGSSETPPATTGSTTTAGGGGSAVRLSSWLF